MFYGVAVIGIATSAATARQDPIAARKALMKETAIRRRSPEPEEGGLQPPSILWAVAVLQARTTATIFMSSGLTITTSSS